MSENHSEKELKELKENWGRLQTDYFAIIKTFFEEFIDACSEKHSFNLQMIKQEEDALIKVYYTVDDNKIGLNTFNCYYSNGKLKGLDEAFIEIPCFEVYMEEKDLKRDNDVLLMKVRNSFLRDFIYRYRILDMDWNEVFKTKKEWENSPFSNFDKSIELLN